jgi:hypothetical protein
MTLVVACFFVLSFGVPGTISAYAADPNGSDIHAAVAALETTDPAITTTDPAITTTDPAITTDPAVTTTDPAVTTDPPATPPAVEWDPPTETPELSAGQSDNKFSFNIINDLPKEKDEADSKSDSKSKSKSDSTSKSDSGKSGQSASSGSSSTNSGSNLNAGSGADAVSGSESDQADVPEEDLAAEDSDLTDPDPVSISDKPTPTTDRNPAPDEALSSTDAYTADVSLVPLFIGLVVLAGILIVAAHFIITRVRNRKNTEL